MVALWMALPRHTECILFAEEALDLYLDLQDPYAEGFELCCMAQWFLNHGRHVLAVAYAEAGVVLEAPTQLGSVVKPRDVRMEAVQSHQTMTAPQKVTIKAQGILYVFFPSFCRYTHIYIVYAYALLCHVQIHNIYIYIVGIICVYVCACVHGCSQRCLVFGCAVTGCLGDPSKGAQGECLARATCLAAPLTGAWW